jgi:hypothetical protein
MTALRDFSGAAGETGESVSGDGNDLPALAIVGFRRATNPHRWCCGRRFRRKSYGRKRCGAELIERCWPPGVSSQEIFTRIGVTPGDLSIPSDCADEAL